MSDEPAGHLERKRSLHAGILIGGSSTRMGMAKATLILEGHTLLERVAAALSGRVDRIYLVGRGHMPELEPAIPQLPDAPGLNGPLAGMIAALRHAPDICWIFAACDMPLVNRNAVEWLNDQRGAERWVVQPMVEAGRVEPLLALYEPESLALLEDLAARGILSPHRLAGHPRVHSPIVPESLRECWLNVNTPEDLEQLRKNFGSRKD